MKLLGYTSDSVAHDLIHSKGRYKIPDHALRDWGIEPEKKEPKQFDKDYKARKSRKEILLQNKSGCYVCDKTLNKYTFSRDHVVPKCKGGKDGKNKVQCCIFCNREKGDKEIQEYIEYLQSLPTSELINRKIENLNEYNLNNQPE